MKAWYKFEEDKYCEPKSMSLCVEFDTITPPSDDVLYGWKEETLKERLLHILKHVLKEDNESLKREAERLIHEVEERL